MSESSCANCAAEIREGARFCDNCGMLVSEAAPTREPPPQEAPAQQPLAPSLTLAPRSLPPRTPPVGQPIPDPPTPQEAPLPLAAREDDQPGWRRHWVLILTLLLPLLVLLLGGTAYALIRATSEDVALPELVGAWSAGEGQGMAGGNLEVVEGDGVESQEPIGTIVEPPEPAAGEIAGEDPSISGEVSKDMNLPDVRGKTRDEAVRILEGVDFEVEEESEESSAQNKNYVIEQDPRGGERETAKAGSTVTITIGAGPVGSSSAPKETLPPPEAKAEESETELLSPPPEAKTEEPEAEPPPPPPDEKAEEPEAEPPPSLPPEAKAEEPKTEPPPPPPPEAEAEEPKTELPPPPPDEKAEEP